jgi:hypothetical protein
VNYAGDDAESAQAVASAGRRYLRTFAVTLGVVAAVLIGMNQLTFRALTTPRYKTVAQMISGWDRTYKPLLFGVVRPDVVAVGASWVRDAFDPALAEELLGRPFFNFGVSGGRPYESQRFLESGLALHEPEHVILNLNSFDDPPDAFRKKFGFNEKLLRVREDGSTNRMVDLHRFLAVNLSGAAVGYNFAVLRAVDTLSSGGDLEEVVESYDRLDFTEWEPALESLRARMVRGEKVGELPPRPKQIAEEEGRFGTLQEILSMLCEREIASHAYYTAHHMLIRECRPTVDREMQAWAMLAAHRDRCRAPITYHVFEYPNGFTLEGVLSERSLSSFYRTDRHPRPTLGILMLARMLGEPFPEGGPPDEADLGIDLLSLPEAEARAWLVTRKARCDGVWGEGELEAAERVASWRE